MYINNWLSPGSLYNSDFTFAVMLNVVITSCYLELLIKIRLLQKLGNLHHELVSEIAQSV
jgi:hypothetical protein